MKQSDLEKITELVTQQVLAALKERSGVTPPSSDGREKILVVGTPGNVLPEALLRRAVCYDLEDYRTHRDILRYDRVFIAFLSTAQLCDIALGRSGDAASCAVVHALLEGVETLMPDEALSYRRYKGRGSSALYQLLESYERTLRAFGVKNPGRERDYTQPPAKPPKYQAPALNVPLGSARPNFSKLITEAEAERLISLGGEVRLPAGSIVTPSARDAFAAAGVCVTEE